MSRSNFIDVSDLVAALDDIQTSFTQADYTETMQQLTRTLEKQHAGYFESSSGPGGAQWPALRPSTVARKGQDRPLIDSGRLQASLAGSGGDALREMSSAGNNSQELLFGTNVPYSAIHQLGGANVPARPHIGTDDATVAQFAEQVGDAVVKALQSG